MEAKDTVMSEEQIEVAIKTGWLPHQEEALTDYELWQLRYKSIAQAQAEISFKAGWEDGYDTGKAFATINMPALVKEGKTEGIREVVEWVKANALYIHPRNLIWQAKLKEWGIE